MYSRLVPWCSDLLSLQAGDPERFPFMLESVSHGGESARFDILFAYPQGCLTLHKNGYLESDGVLLSKPDFLEAFDQWILNLRSTVRPSESECFSLPFTGGWFVFLGYELAQQIEPSLQLPQIVDDFPVAFAQRCPAAVIRDHQLKQSYLVAESQKLMDQLTKDYHELSDWEVPIEPMNEYRASIIESNSQHYVEAVNKAKQYVFEGDVFQVNLSKYWQVNFSNSVCIHKLYEQLRVSNPAPFAGLVRWGNATIMSSSPERLVSVRAGVIETRPIAGTRARSVHSQHDRWLSDELLKHPKERAEHVMLIDLERNDLGRVCIPGSIEVNEFMTLESFQHVHHIVSNVRGHLRAEVSPGKVLGAVFPGGTITGCPKVRCMQIIAELEGMPRGVYTGSMGYVNLDGSMDFNILIRSVFLNQDTLAFRAGAGIVADSDPNLELNECRAKALGILRAIIPTFQFDTPSRSKNE